MYLGNLIKKLVGLSIFQTSVFLLYITIGKVSGGQPPIVESHGSDHGNLEIPLRPLFSALDKEKIL